MMIDFEGDLYICDPKYLSKDLSGEELEKTKKSTISTGINSCYLVVYPVEEFKEFVSGKIEYVKEKISKAYSGYMDRSLGKVGSDTGKIGFYTENQIDLPSIPHGEVFRVRGFRGRLGYFYDSYGMVHFYGSGNYNFYSL